MTEIKNNLDKKYNKGTIAIHWLTFIMIVLLFPIGKYMAGLEGEAKMSLLKTHASFGAIIFLLTLVRTWLFFKAERPANIKTGIKFNDRLVVWVHYAFYILLFGISISGIATLLIGGYASALIHNDAELILSSSNVFSLKGHGLMALILMLLIIMHVVGVAKHYLFTKENALDRIM